MLKKDINANVPFPHPRKRICDVLDDGTEVLVTLKHRERKQTLDEKEWYD